MLRTQSRHKLSTPEYFVAQALFWAQGFEHMAYYGHHNIPYPHHGFREILAVGSRELIVPNASADRFDTLQRAHQKEWLFGYLGYDLKNDVEKLSSENIDRLDFPEMAFFKAEHILFFSEGEVLIDSERPDLFEKIAATQPGHSKSEFKTLQASVSRAEYINTVNRLKAHIEEGDCYEINYCQEFHGQTGVIHPVNLFLELSAISPKPFATFQKWSHQYILCASPERFLKKEGNRLISQPIKGTRPRGGSHAEDEQLAHELRHDEKELAENMMIVDLVRNDLARTAQTGTVKVEELFGIYPFEQVIQMISTVVAELKPEVPFTEAIKHAFPMGSMTGAPKVKVMELIEQYEAAKRGPFSGAAGYITPAGDFDFNVLIRSLFLDEAQKRYSFQVGSAITYDSVAEKEYEECLVKAKAIGLLIGQPIGE